MSEKEIAYVSMNLIGYKMKDMSSVWTGHSLEEEPTDRVQTKMSKKIIRSIISISLK